MSYWPLKALSVPCLRVTSNCNGVSCCFHSASVLWTFLTRAVPSFWPESLNWTTVTVSLSSEELEFVAPKRGFLSQAIAAAPATTESARKLLRFMDLSDITNNQPNVKANACTPGSRTQSRRFYPPPVHFAE